MDMLIVDAHEDVAWNALALDRDVCRSALDTRRLEEDGDAPRRYGRCTVGLPECLAGCVAVVFGTVFVTPARQSFAKSQAYANAEEAHRLGQAQLDV